jgi:hypothetical protein
MLLDRGAAIRGIQEELALLRELLRGGLPLPHASLPASSAVALPMSSTGPFVVMETSRSSPRATAVRLQAAVRDLLARRCFREVRQQWEAVAAALELAATSPSSFSESAVEAQEPRIEELCLAPLEDGGASVECLHFRDNLATRVTAGICCLPPPSPSRHPASPRRTS